MFLGTSKNKIFRGGGGEACPQTPQKGVPPALNTQYPPPFKLFPATSKPVDNPGSLFCKHLYVGGRDRNNQLKQHETTTVEKIYR